jgi:hypothetical protein
MNPFIQTGFNTPFACSTSPFFGGINGFPGVSGFNQGFGAWNSTPWNTPFNSTNAWTPNWNPGFSTGFTGGIDPIFNAGFNGGFNSGFNPGFNISGFNGGFTGATNPGFNWNVPFGWSSPFNGFWNTPFNAFPGFSPFASTPVWNSFPGAFWNNTTSNGANISNQEGARFNNSTPTGGFPFGVPFFNPGAFGPVGATPNGEQATARNAA